MSQIINVGWLKDNTGEKFAPKTLVSQVVTNDGVQLNDKIEADFLSMKQETNASIENAVNEALSNLEVPEVNDHINNENIHITDIERTDWDNAKEHATSTHAPVDAQVNVIEEIRINGEVITPDEKVVDITVPTKVSDLANDRGFLDIETDPTVPAWAKEATKPTYTFEEVGADKQGSADAALEEAMAYTDERIDAIIGEGATETLDTIGEIAQAFAEHKEVAEALNSAIGTKANKDELTSHTEDVSHITETERANWNEAKNHADSTHARTDATKTESSETNGNILIDGVETTVYVHPEGTNPHGTTKEDLGLENVENKSSETIRSEITKKNVTDALGYTPATTDTTYDAAGESLGLMKSGGDLTIVDGVATVNDLDSKVPETRTINGKALSTDITLSASDIGADMTGTADSLVTAHNISTASHSDIRDLITSLTDRLNALADSDDITLDQMSEVVAYIKDNKDLIESVTTAKVNVSDIINDLTTNVSNKPLSAAQGVAIKELIDALQTEVNSKADSSDLTSHTGNATIHITSDERDSWNDAKTHASSAHARTDATKVEVSNVNGNIIIDGVETTVYKPSESTYGDLTKEIVVSALGYTPLDESLKGVANGVAELDENGKISDKQLPDVSVTNTVSGENIHVDDSTDNKPIEFHLYGKTKQVVTSGANLLNCPDVSKKTAKGVSVEVKDSHVHLIGTPTEAELIYLSGGYSETETLFTLEPGDYVLCDGIGLLNFDGTTRVNKRGKFTLTEEFNVTAVQIRSSEDSQTFYAGTYYNISIDMMLNRGTELLPFEPYTDGKVSPSPEYEQDVEVATNPTVKNTGKNLYKIKAKSQTINGVTFTVNADGSVIANGTARATVYYNLGGFGGGGKYVLSGSPINGSGSKYRLYIKYGDADYAYDDGNGATFEKDNTERSVVLFIANGYTVNNLTFYPMISVEGGEYEPYKETTATIQGEYAGISVSSGGNYTDSNGQQWISDEVVKYADGTGEKIQRILKKRVLSSLNWLYSTTTNRFYASDKDFEYGKEGLYYPNAICTHFTKMFQQDLETDLGFAYVNNGTKGYAYRHTSLNGSIDEWKTFLDENEVYILGALAEPIRTPLTAEEIAEIEKLSMFNPVTNISNDADCGMSIKYIKNTSDGEFLKEIYNNMNNSEKLNDAYEHSKSEHAPSDARANVIELVKVNGTALTPNSKAVDITVPTKLSELTNDSGFLTSKPTYTYDEVGAEKEGTASTLVGEHNTNTDAHNDIRLLIENITTRLNALANSTDVELDQMAELVEYIKDNRELIEGVTTNKVNVSDIVNNLVTNVTDKPLSAAMGVEIKALIDALQTAVDNTVDLGSEQTITGSKTFSGTVSVTNTTASTSTSTGALKVTGGVGIGGRMSSNEVMISDKVILKYNTNTESLDFIFS